MVVAFTHPSATRAFTYPRTAPSPRVSTRRRNYAVSIQASELVSRALTEKHQLMKAVKTLLKSPDYGWDDAWVDGVTAAIMTKRLDTTVDKTKAAIDYLVSKGIPVHRVENMVSINKQILAMSVEALRETVEYVEGKGIQGQALVHFLETNPVILRYGPVSGSDEECLALRRAGGLDTKSMAKVVKDGRGELQCVYYRQGVVLGTSPIGMVLRK